MVGRNRFSGREVAIASRVSAALSAALAFVAQSIFIGGRPKEGVHIQQILEPSHYGGGFKPSFGSVGFVRSPLNPILPLTEPIRVF